MAKTLMNYLLKGALVFALGTLAWAIFLIGSQYPEPTVTARFFAFCQLAIPLNMLSFVLLLYRQYRFTWTDLTVVLYTVYFYWHFYATDSPAPNRLILFVCLSQLYFFLRLSRSFFPQFSKWAMLILFFTGCSEAVLGFKQLFGYSFSHHNLYSVTGSFFNPGPYGGYMAFVFCLAFSHIISHYKAIEQRVKKREKGTADIHLILDVVVYAAAFICVILSFTVIPATKSRSAWVAAALVSMLVLSREFKIIETIKSYFLRKKLKTIIGCLMALIGVTAIAGSAYNYKKGSADGRRLVWKVTARAISDSPVTGVGTGFFGGAFASAQAELFEQGKLSKQEIKVADSPAYAFNEYLQITLEQGWPGILFFLALVLLSLRRFITAPNEWQYGLIALLVFAFTSYPFRVLPLMVVFVLTVGLQPGGKPLLGMIPGKVFTGLFLVGLLFFHGKTSRTFPLMQEAYLNWKAVQIFHQMKIYDDKLADDYQKTLPWLTGESAYLFEYGQVLHSQGEYQQSNEILLQGSRLSCDPMYYNIMGNNFKFQGLTEEAEQMYLKAFAVLPNRIYPLYLLAKLHEDTGNMESAAFYARKVLLFQPKVESAATQEMKEAMRSIGYTPDNWKKSY